MNKEEPKTTVFTLESARAALKLGPVTYRCNACGKIHNVKQGCPTRCLEDRIRSAFDSPESVAVFKSTSLALVEFVEAFEDSASRSFESVSSSFETGLAEMFLVSSLYDSLSVLIAACGLVGDPRLKRWKTVHKGYAVLIVSPLARCGLRGLSDLDWILMADPPDANREIVRLTCAYLANDCSWPSSDLPAFDMCAPRVVQSYHVLRSKLNELVAKRNEVDG